MLNKPFKIFILVCILMMGMHAIAQQKTPIRLELNARMDEDSYKLIPCGEYGLIIFFEEDQVLENGNKNWQFALFEKDFQESWVKVVELQKGMDFYKEVILGQTLIMFFHNVEGKKSDGADYQVLRIALTDGDNTLFNGQFEEKADPTAFKVIEDKLWAGMYLKKGNAQLCLLNLRDGQQQIIPIDIPNQNIIGNIFHDTVRNEVSLVIQNYESKLQNTIYIQKYELDGQLKGTTELKAVLPERYLNEAELVFKDGVVFALGTYNGERGKIPFEGEDGLVESTGFYIAKIRNGEQLFINYYNFLEFENLYNSLSGRDIMRVRKKAEKQKTKGEEYSLNYTLLLHRVREYDGNLILMAEAFYPEYRTVTNMYYDYYGRLMPQTYTVFDGYKYFNGIIAAFDQQGNLVWDNDIEVWNVLTFVLDKYLNVFFRDREMAIFYNWEGKINYKIIDLVQQTADADQVPLELKYNKDRVLEEKGSRITYWYDQYFIAYGYQDIRNNSMARNKRTVFYVNKVAFQ